MNRVWQISLLLFVASTCGCAEGPLWQTGKYVPWARQQWQAEEQIADTLFVRKRRMTELVERAAGGPLDEQQKAAMELKKVVHNNPVLLLRLHAVNLLGRLNCPAAIQTLADASHDPNSDVRIAAIRSWEKMPAEDAVPHLQELIGSDTDIDVQLAATRALRQFPGDQTILALSLALEDRNPALQVRATESLQIVTGEPIGRNVSAWQDYIAQTLPVNRMLPNETIPAEPQDGQFQIPFGQQEQMASESGSSSSFKR